MSKQPPNEKQAEPREFNEREFRREWAIRGVGMGMPIDVPHGAHCYHMWISEPAYQALQEKLRMAVKALKSAVECDEEFWGKRGRSAAELAIQKIEAQDE